MASDLYLYRKDRRWQKFAKIDEITLTGAQTVYPSVTGDNTTDVVTIVGNELANNDPVYFTSLTGGSALAVNTTYYVVNKNGNDFQLAASAGGSAGNLGSNITAGVLIHSRPELSVWSSEFRDQFNSNMQGQFGGSAQSSTSNPFGGNGVVLAYGGGSSARSEQGPSMGGSAPSSGLSTTITTSGFTLTPTVNTLSDEAAHIPLRQTLLKKTHWRFKQANNTTPVYLYAVWADGDQISNSPPETE
jgi:hypothetical protein